MSTKQNSQTTQIGVVLKAITIVVSVIIIMSIAIKISTSLSWMRAFTATFFFLAVSGIGYALTKLYRNRKPKARKAISEEKHPPMQVVPYEMPRPVLPVRPKRYEHTLHWLEVAWLPIAPAVLIAAPLLVVVLKLRLEFWLIVGVVWFILPYLAYSAWWKWANRPYSCNTEDLLLKISEKGLLFFVRNSSNDPISLKECTLESGGQSLIEQILGLFGSSSQTLTVYQGGKPARKPIRHFRDLDDLLAIQTWWHAQMRYEAELQTYNSIRIERNTREIAEMLRPMSPRQIERFKASLDAENEETKEE